MRKLEINAYTIEEAKEKAYEKGITVIQDMTFRWMLAGKPLFPSKIDILATDFLNKRGLFDFEGAGVIVAISPGRPDDQKKPGILHSFKQKGLCKRYRVVEIRSKETDELLGTAPGKLEAIKLAKQIMKEKLTTLYAKTVYDTDRVDFELEYVPSKRRKLGQYLVFGVDAEDVKLSRRNKLRLKHNQYDDRELAE